MSPFLVSASHPPQAADATRKREIFACRRSSHSVIARRGQAPDVAEQNQHNAAPRIDAHFARARVAPRWGAGIMTPTRTQGVALG
jgi:hypothetical protein